MKKFLNRSVFFNWPAFVLSLMLCVAFIVTTALVSCRDFSYGQYYYEDEQEDVTYQYIIDIKKENECDVIQVYIEELSIKVTKIECEYLVYEDKLFISDAEPTAEQKEYKCFGEIDAFKIKGDKDDLTNDDAVSLKISCIVLTVLFAICAVVNVLVVVLSKKQDEKEVLIGAEKEQKNQEVDKK